LEATDGVAVDMKKTWLIPCYHGGLVKNKKTETKKTESNFKHHA
jgi:hypothetical protein